MSKSTPFIPVEGTAYGYDARLQQPLQALLYRVNAFRTLIGTLSAETLATVRDYFRLKNVYNSNAIEGNSLSMGETELVISEGLTITGKPLKDTIEARNLALALDFFEELAKRDGVPITPSDLRNIHKQILAGIDERNAGAYRTVRVEISGSKYMPPDPARIDEMMREFGAWLEQASTKREPYRQHDPVVLACLAHAWFVYIHPFIDGNGRTARLLMNLMLIRNGYPIAILTKDDRYRYYDALEESQGGGNLTPFVELVMEAVRESIQVYEDAGKQQLDIKQRVAWLVDESKSKLKNEYEVFESAMRLLQSYFTQVAAEFEAQHKQSNLPAGVGFKPFSPLEFEKYQSLRFEKTAKRTWFFRLTFFNRHNRQAEAHRYLFFYGFSSDNLNKHLGEGDGVSLYVAMETYPYYYEKLVDLQDSTLPRLIEISYASKEQAFVCLTREGSVVTAKARDIASQFIEAAMRRYTS